MRGRRARRREKARLARATERLAEIAMVYCMYLRSAGRDRDGALVYFGYLAVIAMVR